MTPEEEMMMQKQKAMANASNEMVSADKANGAAAAGAEKAVAGYNLSARDAALKALAKKMSDKKKKGPIAGIEPWLKGKGKAKVDPGFGRIAPKPGEKIKRTPQPKAVPLDAGRRWV